MLLVTLEILESMLMTLVIPVNEKNQGEVRRIKVSRQSQHQELPLGFLLGCVLCLLSSSFLVLSSLPLTSALQEPPNYFSLCVTEEEMAAENCL